MRLLKHINHIQEVLAENEVLITKLLKNLPSAAVPNILRKTNKDNNNHKYVHQNIIKPSTN